MDNIRELFPAHSRKIDILEQRISGTTTLSNDATDEEKAEEEVLDSDEDESSTPIKLADEVPKQPNKLGQSLVGQVVQGMPGTRDSTHKYGRFSQEEDRKIIEGYAKFGNRWDEIARWGNLDRTSSQISSRFTRKLCKSASLSSTLQSTRDDSQERAQLSSKGMEIDEQPPAKQRRLDSSGRLETGLGRQEVGRQQDTTTGTSGKLDSIPPVSPNTSSNESSTPRTGTTSDGGAMKQESIVSHDATAKLSEDWKGLQTERERLSTLEHELKDRESKLKEWESKLKEWESRLKDWEWKVQQKGTEEHGRISEIVRQQLILRTRAQRSLARKKLAEDCQRFGQSTFERRGPEMQEVWQDGELFLKIDEQLRALAVKREQLEQTKKQLAKKRQSAVDGADTSTGDMEEICKVRILGLKREEAALQDEREHLQAMKMLHMKELKRTTDEDQSRFNDFPLLRDSRYLLLSLLGKGGFSEVYHAFDLRELREVACKIHSVNTMWSTTKRQNYTKHAVREYMIHKELVHPKVVRLYDVFEIDANSFCTVLEYCESGDMDSYLKQHKLLSEREAKCIVSQIFSGLKYLSTQKRPIIHYDLKPGNILFQSNGEVKITDFGLSKIMEEDSEFVELTSQGAGTYWYLPPECFEMGGKHPPMISSKVDVWSVGVIFYQMLYGKKPFGNEMSQQKFLTENVAAQTTRVEFPSKPVVSKEAKDFLQKCLTHNQMLRPDVQTICLDPFLAIARGGKKITPQAPVSAASNPQMPPPKANAKRKIDGENT